MNQLWARLSLTYALVTAVIVTLVVIIVFQLLAAPDFSQLDHAEFSTADIAALQQLQESGVLSRFLRGLFSLQLTFITLVATLAGALVSIWASRRLTRPLTQLEEATRRVGQRELGFRVESSGTDEMIALAEAFNRMVAQLDTAETLRQNLLADVSHELRTPLTVLQGSLRNALDDMKPLDPPQIAMLYDQTRQLNHLIADLHDLAQAEANRLPLQMMGVDFGDLVRQVCNLFAPLAADDGIEIVVESPTVVPLIRGDRTRLIQVLQNLVANALRYARSTVTLGLAQEDDRLLLTVADDGAGIAPEQVPHIFDRFYRADSSRTRETGGSGLGLAIVKSIVEAHNGTISVESAPDRGTCLTISFPLAPPDNPRH